MGDFSIFYSTLMQAMTNGDYQVAKGLLSNPPLQFDCSKLNGIFDRLLVPHIMTGAFASSLRIFKRLSKHFVHPLEPALWNFVSETQVIDAIERKCAYSTCVRIAQISFELRPKEFNVRLLACKFCSVETVRHFAHEMLESKRAYEATAINFHVRALFDELRREKEKKDTLAQKRQLIDKEEEEEIKHIRSLYDLKRRLVEADK